MEAKPEFDQLVEQHGREIYVYLYRLLREPADAEDCLQEAFLRAYRAYDRLDAGANYRAWLYRIAHNLAMTYLKQRARQAEQLPDQLPSPEPPIEQRFEQGQLLDRMRAAVKSLPPKQRSALVMRKYQELSYDEIALALEIRPEAARANVYQGLKNLRSRLSAAADASPVQSEREEGRGVRVTAAPRPEKSQ